MLLVLTYWTRIEMPNRC